jgi:riboflavin transporter
MEQTKTLSIKKFRTLDWLQIAGFIGIASLAPLFFSQPITGTIVNATLFSSTALFGYKAGILVGISPSLIALSIGLLNPILAPMVPFIILSNIILVSIFAALKPKNFLLGILTASLAKFLFLFLTSSIIITFLIPTEVAPTIAKMMTWPQLLTALAGGMVAYLQTRNL